MAKRPSVWFTYIGTPDVDATARQVQQLGGKVHRQPADIPTVGRFAMVADPQGAVFAIFTPSTPAPPDTDRRPDVGDFSWQELLTTDWQAAWDFSGRINSRGLRMTYPRSRAARPSLSSRTFRSGPSLPNGAGEPMIARRRFRT